ncbi:MAG: CRISPR-associated endonuclease Cas2 [Gemmatimonadaceae bacterium]|nr:CRISPR-associated endonuclease Cas2 [Gemmatimonadaceae bacterium]
MRRRYLVAYDVSDAQRLRRTYRVMNGFGDPVQYSLFVCDLSPVERQIMHERLTAVINLKDDRVLIVDLGAADSRLAASFDVLGRQLAIGRDSYQATVI